MNTRIRAGSRTALALSAVTALSVGASPALGQPNPFDDYEAGVPAVDLEEPEAAADDEWADAEGPGEEAEQPPVASDYSVDQWLWSVGLSSIFSYAGTTNETLGGTDESNRTLYLRLAPRVGFFPLERFEVGLALGLLTQLAARESGDSVAQNNFYFDATAQYHILVGSGFAIVPALGLGAYFGLSSRTLQLPSGQSIDESTSTRGFLVTGTLGVGYQPSESWRLRSGVSVSGLFGSETVSATPSRREATLGSSAVNIGIPIEVSYLF